MNNLRIGDFVLYNGYAYEIKAIDGEYLTLNNYDDQKPLIVKAIMTEYLPPEYMSEEEIRKIYRYEEYYDQVTHHNDLLNTKGIEDLDVTLEDIECALTNFDKKHDFEHFEKYWARNIYPLLVRQFKLMLPSCNIYSRYRAYRDFLDELAQLLNNSIGADDDDIENMMNYMHDHLIDNLQNLNLPPKKRYYRPDDVEYFTFMCSTTFALNYSDEDTIETFRYLLSKKLKQNDPFACLISARMHIYPNPAYDVDYKFAQEKLEYLAENFHGGFSIDAMDLLGDLYFQGYLNNGEPNYEKAFVYYNTATINHHQSAPGKLARMYYEGLYVPHSDFTTYSLIENVSEEMISRFLNDFDSDNSLPEIMLYKAKLLEDDLNDYNVWYHAYYYLLQADFYSKMRRNIDVAAYLNDTQDAIDKYLEIIRSSKHYKKLKLQPLANLQQILAFNNMNNGQINYTIDEVKDGRLFTFKRAPKTVDDNEEEHDEPSRLFVVIPEMDFAGFVDQLKVLVKDKFKDSVLPFDTEGIITSLKGNVGYLYTHISMALDFGAYTDALEPHNEYGIEPPKLYFDEKDFEVAKTPHKLAHIYDARDPLNGLIVIADGLEDVYPGKIFNLNFSNTPSYIRVDDVYDGRNGDLLYGVQHVLKLKEHIVQKSNNSLNIN